jgi:hypothetical protein
MIKEQIVLWQPKLPVRVPATAIDAKEIVPFANAHQLTTRDKRQIISAFENDHYEMMSSFVWTKALSSLKAQLGKLGAAFISEMLDRPDIDASSSIDQALTDYDALRLAQELGVISGTGALRLRQALERLTHFGQLSPDEAEETAMTSDEAIGLLRACIENILGQEKIEAALDFKEFRDRLETGLYEEDEIEVQRLLASPYFFQRASVRILLALIKSTRSAQLENTLANANVIIPLLWDRLLGPEKHQVGRAYAELASEGKATATAGLKKVLLKVRGFDFVPEDLRSTSFVKAANAILAAHEGRNNFYTEPAPVKYLDDMGSVIPTPAFPICMSAVLSVRLGNRYGISYDAQRWASSILKRVSKVRWAYFLNDCLKTDDRILYKLLEDNPLTRWNELASEFSLGTIATREVTDRTVRQIAVDAEAGRSNRVHSLASKLINQLGYEAKSH